MNDKVFSDDSGHIEVLEQHSLTITQFANACNVSETWVVQRVHSGVVDLAGEGDASPGTDVQTWRFPGHGIVRTRRIADLERTFDADPQLAALTADLMEEVGRLRALLRLPRQSSR